MKINSIKKNIGVGLIEVVIVSSLVLVIFSGLMSVFNFYIKKSVTLTDNIKAEFLAEEALEALRVLRDGDFANLSSLPRDTYRYLYWNGTGWLATSTPEVIDGIFTRKFKVFDVYRDGAGNIAPAGTLDAEILLAETSVIWQDNQATSTRTISTYLSNVLAN